MFACESSVVSAVTTKLSVLTVYVLTVRKALYGYAKAESSRIDTVCSPQSYGVGSMSSVKGGNVEV